MLSRADARCARRRRSPRGTHAALPPATRPPSRSTPRKVEGRISPLLYGQFIEFMYEGIKRGLHAELIRNRGFEESANAIGSAATLGPLPRRSQRRLRHLLRAGTTRSPIPTRVRAGSAAERALAARRAPSRRDGAPRRATRRACRSGRASNTAATCGSEPGRSPGAVTVALEAGPDRRRHLREAALGEHRRRVTWRQYAFTLRPAQADPLARLAILFTGAARVWIDQVSLMPGDAVGGVRADVVRAVKALRPAFIRWPGGNVAQDYRWRWGVGPRDERPTWINLSWKNEPEPGDFGTDEFIRFCRHRRGRAALVRSTSRAAARPPKRRRRGSSTATVRRRRRTAAMRAQHGHPEPFGVKTWEIGNEIWGDWVRGHSDAATYARN